MITALYATAVVAKLSRLRPLSLMTFHDNTLANAVSVAAAAKPPLSLRLPQPNHDTPARCGHTLVKPVHVAQIRP